MSRKIIFVLSLIALDCVYGLIRLMATGDLSLPPFFGFLVLLYWVALIYDGVMMYRRAKRRKMMRRVIKHSVTEKPTTLRKAG